MMRAAGWLVALSKRLFLSDVDALFRTALQSLHGL
jgi:hypothetical protein